MSGRFVRKSHFRHVFGKAEKKEKSYTDIPLVTNGDGDHLAVSPSYLAFATRGGGGPLAVYEYGKVGRVTSGVKKINPHTSKVLDFSFSPFAPNVLGSCSEDCMVSITTLPKDPKEFKGDSEKITMEGHTKKVDLLSWSPTALNILASAAHDGYVKVWDCDEGKEALSCDVGKECSSITWSGDGSRIAVACPDKMTRLIDPRSPKDMVKLKTGLKTAKSVFHENVNLFGCGGSAMGAREYHLWDLRKLDSDPVHEFEVDDSAGMMLMHYDPDTSMLYIGGKGGAQVKYFEMTNKSGYMHKLSIYSMKTGIKGFTFLPKRMCDWKKCVIAKGLMLYRDWINPVDFIVPRKSQLFAEHLYPDTYAGVPSLSGADWLGGETKGPVKMSMNPKKAGQAIGGGAPKVVVRSKADVMKENSALKKRIAELEAEVKKLKGE